jgi:hypothetical protein
MYDNNKLYTTASTLTGITEVKVTKIEGKYLPRSEVVIKPEENYH